MRASRARSKLPDQCVIELKQYFDAHVKSGPEPPNEWKEDMAKKHGVTVTQIRNWLNGKRGDYRKAELIVQRFNDEEELGAEVDWFSHNWGEGQQDDTECEALRQSRRQKWRFEVLETLVDYGE